MSRSVFCCLAGLVWISGAWAQNAATDPGFFSTKVYPVLEDAHCRICHTSAGVASGTRIHFPEKDASREQIEIFGLSLAAVVDRAVGAGLPAAKTRSSSFTPSALHFRK